MSNLPHALEIQPDTELQFSLSLDESTPRCTMTLRHPGNTLEHLAFKVKTTQPRRYLVRPNQGLIAPHKSETVSILLVEKDKQVLLRSYERLGQSALDHSKDKFLVQSCPVSDQFTEATATEDLYEALTSMWNAVTSGGSTTPVFNKKLHVRHVVVEAAAAPAATTTSTTKAPIEPHDNTLAAIEQMSPEQLLAEISNLRRKYDELVSFSVNLTAERDLLNNTLEQTKRDLNREITSRSSMEHKQGGGAAAAKGAGGKSQSSVLRVLLLALIVGVVCFVLGVRMAQDNSVVLPQVLSPMASSEETASSQEEL